MLAADGAVATATTASGLRQRLGASTPTRRAACCRRGRRRATTPRGAAASPSCVLVGPVSGGVAPIPMAGGLHDHVAAGPGDDDDGRRPGNSQASGVASSYSNYGGLTESAGSSGSGDPTPRGAVCPPATPPWTITTTRRPGRSRTRRWASRRDRGRGSAR